MILAIEPAATLLDTARALRPQIEACREQIERERRLPPELVDALSEADMFRMVVPRELGGAEADPMTVTRVVEELSRADGSVGWSVMLANQTAYAAALLRPDTAREIFGDRRSSVAGSVTRGGQAVRVSGGYRVTGRWSFASGSDHATWMGCVSAVVDEDGPVLGPDDSPQLLRLHLPIEQCEIIDTWSTTRLRGTASHDFQIQDVFVPEERAVRFPVNACQVHGVRALVLMGHGGQALGVAQAAIDALITVAEAKQRRGAPTTMRDDPIVQSQIAQADVLVASARRHLYGTAEEIWEAAGSDAEVTPLQIARLRLALANAVTSSAQAVDLMYAAGGASAIYASNPLDRHFRDIHTAAAHMLVSPGTYVQAGRVLLGLEPTNPLFLI